ncbi:hypothetical protein WQ54_25255 [Bacillus sp. SA1-12]|nr:hypothetical protein WQ54_25255 [Bacillus sp. SA1-12]
MVRFAVQGGVSKGLPVDTETMYKKCFCYVKLIDDLSTMLIGAKDSCGRQGISSGGDSWSTPEKYLQQDHQTIFKLQAFSVLQPELKGNKTPFPL